MGGTEPSGSKNGELVQNAENDKIQTRWRNSPGGKDPCGNWQPEMRRGAAAKVTEGMVHDKEDGTTELNSKETGICTKKMVTSSLKVMVAGIKEIATQIAIL